MGVACGDLNGDGLPDLAVTNFYNEYTALYQNLGDGVFSDHSAEYGLVGRQPLPARVLGWLFLISTTMAGSIWSRPMAMSTTIEPDVPQLMRAQLFAGTAAGGKLLDVTDRAGPAFQVPLAGARVWPRETWTTTAASTF